MMVKSYAKLRSCILHTLYEHFKQYPYAPLEFDQILVQCDTDARQLNWNMVYLEKCGFVELGKSFTTAEFIACSAAISAEGIDLVENESEFKKRFPAE